MKLIVGLGNPGEKYLGTRHNLGFATIDALVVKLLPSTKSGKFWQVEKKFKSEIGEIEINGEKIVLVKPQTYMNNSGMAVSLIKNYYKISPEDIIIVHDDLDLVLGKIKVRIGGAAGGHHGVESIITALGTDRFLRLKMGIGNDKSHSGERKRISFNAEKFVLETFLSNEKPKIKHLIKQAIGALEMIIAVGLEEAQSNFN